ncbi:MAG: TolC family outer membrane protein [Steroidobacteraceae bacterium]
MSRLAFLFGLGAMLALAPAARSTDLVDVYQRALQNDPQLREAEATRLAALEAKPQAVSALLPQISGVGSWQRDHESGLQDQVQRITDPTNPTGNTEIHFNQDGTSITRSHRYGLELRQSIFSWTNWVALKRADSQVAQAEADYQSARQELVTRVAQRYFDVLAAQDDLDAQQAAANAIQHQLDQSEQRFNVGLIAITDVQEARAAHDSAAADVIAAKRQLSTAQEALREITGESFASLARPVESMELASPSPASEEQWVQKALEQNLALISSRLSADIAREDISTARGGYTPSVDFVATGGKNVSDGDITYSLGGTGASAIDLNYRTIGVQVTIPLYSGGATNSRVREAVYRHRASRERLERIARQTERDTRDAYLGVLSEISRVKALKQALESNLTALKASEAGYEAGTRTAVDVLQSRRLLILAQTNYARSRYDYILNMLKLQSEAGLLTRQSLDGINTQLKDSAPKITDPGIAPNAPPANPGG